MKKILNFVLAVALGAIIGYVLHPTISKKLEGTKVEQAVEAVSDVSNEAVQNKLDSAEAKKNIENFE